MDGGSAHIRSARNVQSLDLPAWHPTMYPVAPASVWGPTLHSQELWEENKAISTAGG